MTYEPRTEEGKTIVRIAEEMAQEIAELKRERERLLTIAEHLFVMVPPSAWRDSGGDDGQGHYEGEYRAEQLHEELQRMREAA